VIPKIIHQVWLGGSMPEKLAQLHDKMKETNPSWKVKLWDEESIDILLCDCFAYSHSTKAGSSNVVRLKALQKYGGVYFDLDFVAVRSIDELEKHSAFVARQPDGVLCNAAIGATPSHPWINAMLENYGEYQKKDAAWGCHVIEPNLTPDVTILPTDTFYPYGHGETTKPPTENTLAYHLWEGSWL
jgi:mannosyltransferase OCH1-like enzyme